MILAEIPEFQRYGTAHLVVLAITFLLPILLVAWAKTRKNHIDPVAIASVLALILLLNKVAVLTYTTLYNAEAVPWTQRFPMHLCDWVSFIAAAALITRHKLMFELSYFWGLAGTFQGVITPDLPYGYPHFYFFTFNISHSGIVIAVLYMVFATDLRPHWGSLIRAALWLQFYLICTLYVNWLLGENYGYLSAKPVNPSLLDYMGPWPWYIGVLEVVAMIFFVILYLPWAIRDQWFSQETESSAKRSN